jgi:hypothetical protein
VEIERSFARTLDRAPPVFASVSDRAPRAVFPKTSRRCGNAAATFGARADVGTAGCRQIAIRGREVLALRQPH